MSNSSGIIFDVKHFAVHDGPGIRTTIFFKGCPLRCSFCHNPESQNPSPEEIMNPSSSNMEIVGTLKSVHEIMTEIEKDIIFFDESGGGVTISGGEPLLQVDFLLNILKMCKEFEIHTALDTTGYASVETIKAIDQYVDLYLYDLKFINSTKHEQHTGVSNEKILFNLKYLDKNQKNVNIRIPLIPNLTDTDENILEIGEYVRALSSIKNINLLPYNRFGEQKYHRLNRNFELGKIGQLKTQSDKELNRIKNMLEVLGIKVNIGG
ncbi:MAG: glycyl-radical enzyme activating protein [Candidatus Hodarchaeales archaeon]